ncbi:lipid-A-disaccharide kinase [Syntrophus gentianae]|uniref:Tetraacyldisaccharide 4'-kinase n=1 Tax=Syntrophus gentianae TaxID=43775 RepID=A0A1H7WAZ4_9BACT|nr:tetraacyldisaccharide 4'-kinase [Syntrophus gentianae]SEM18249.1 lipid-A-disaccharide kinase [Syntrophus gentianae]
MNLRDRCRQLWNAPEPHKNGSPFALFLSILSLFYRSGVALRNALYDRGFSKSFRLPCKVISVGNVTVGGTGKTPVVVLLARMLKEHGYRPAVLSRGYGSKGAAPVNIVSDGESILLGPREGGDEPVLIAESVPGIPVLSGPDRYLTGKTALSRLDADVLILDDGFQHRRLFRDLNIVLLDVDRPWGNGFLLPRGPLREPPAGALKRADLLIRTGEGKEGNRGEIPGYFNDVPGSERTLLGSLPVFRGTHQPRALISRHRGQEMEPRDLKGKRICAFAGIGTPERFRKTLESLGAEITAFLSFPDHHRYSPSDLDFLEQEAKKAHAEMIVTTEKDEIKLMSLDLPAMPCYSLRIEMNIDPREDFERLILGMLKKNQAKT